MWLVTQQRYRDTPRSPGSDGTVLGLLELVSAQNQIPVVSKIAGISLSPAHSVTQASGPVGENWEENAQYNVLAA